MSSPQIQRLTDVHQLAVVNADNLEEFVSAHEHSVLFFCGDPVKYPESNDVAMVLPELLKVYQGRLQGATLAPEDEQGLHRRFGFTSWPSLVFLRRGELLGVISKIQNWEDYLQQINRLLAGESKPMPIPVDQLVD